MNKLIVAAATFIAFTFCAGSCVKKNVIPVNSDEKAHYYYKPGSYWVYIDTVSGRYDSFSVEKTSDYTIEESSIKSYAQIVITIIDRTNIANNLEVSLSDNDKMQFRFTILNSAIIATDFTYPLNSSINRFEIFLLYNINGINYTNVAQINDGNSYFINDSAGIIEAILYDQSKSINIVWQLCRYKIII